MQLLSPDIPRRSRGPLSSKNGSFVLAGLLALVAAGALLVFLREYKDDLTGSDPVQVLVAKSLVPKGTPGNLVADEQLYKIERVENAQVESGAITDPSSFAGKVLVRDVHPGHQFRSTDFGTGRAVQARLSGYHRAMTVPVNRDRGMIGDIQAGDHVDVVVTYDNSGIGPGAAGIAAQDVLVLSMPEASEDSGSASEGAATLRVNDADAPTIAAARDTGEVWLVLRPSVGARSHSLAEVMQRRQEISAGVLGQ